MLSQNDIKEELSHAYVHAVASACAFGFDRPTKDRDSVDVVLAAKGRLDLASVLMSPRLDLQLKATCDFNESNGELSFRLKKKNYDELRLTDLMVPRILVVLILPSDQDQWLDVNADQLVARRCAFWCNLKGMPEITTETTTIKIPTANLFDVTTLKDLMVKVSKGESIG